MSNNRSKFVGVLILSLTISGSVAQHLHAQGPGGPGGPSSSELKLVEKFDRDSNGILNATERSAARQFVEQKASARRRRPGRRRFEPGKPGPKVDPASVISHTDAKFYDINVLRTIFLEFENDKWEKELEVFKPTDVEVPATMTVDGKKYKQPVGVSFRGASSFFMIPAGLKRSFNISVDFVDKQQRLYSYKTLNLLNCNGDPSMMSSALYSYLCGKKIATPKANFVKVVVNGESWGLYVSSQQFNKVFTKENFSSAKGARWKASGSPRGDGGLRYFGEELEPYRRRYEIKSRDEEKSWHELIQLCKVINETPQDQLEEALEPILDVDGALWFLAVDIVLVNSDGYWTRASDYNIYKDPAGKFHILPHDMNEAFRLGRGGRGGGQPPKGRDDKGGRPPRGGFGRGGGPTLDPLNGLDNSRMPLRSVLLNHPKYQKRYLQYVKELAVMLQWKNLGPNVKQIRELLKDEVARDTRKLFSNKAFLDATQPEKPSEESRSIRRFLEQRSQFLLNLGKIRTLK